ncbi:MAG: hypothetical protein C0518_03610 [Opitutus sp.]|nr:hypothetical protein [Opitutus sp.]
MSVTAPSRTTSGFTLLELLVVSGLIAGLAALMLRGYSSTSGVAMRQTESALGAKLTLARSTAIKLGRPVRLVVNLDSANPDERLALVALLAQDRSDGSWNLLAPPLRLGAQVRIVPESSVPAASGVAWPAQVVSRWSATAAIAPAGLPPGHYGYLEFSASGGLFGNPKLVFSIVERQALAFTFNSPDQVRCFLVRGSGVATLFKEAASIP